MLLERCCRYRCLSPESDGRTCRRLRAQIRGVLGPNKTIYLDRLMPYHNDLVCTISPPTILPHIFYEHSCIDFAICGRNPAL